MKTLPTILLAAGVSVVASALTATIVTRSGRTDDEAKWALQALRIEHDRLRESVEELHAAPRKSPTPQPGVTAGEVEAIVSRAVEEIVKREEPKAQDAGAVAASVRRLTEPALADEERSAIWEHLAESGMIDEVVGEFRKRAEASPQDSIAHSDLGAAYLQRSIHSGGGAGAGKWARMGSEAYAKALELDATYWAARFGLARHLVDTDQQDEAIRNLEILREQQKDRTAEARHAEAFVLLGNVYLKQGKAAKAKEVWEEGSKLFPDHERLGTLAKSVE